MTAGRKGSEKFKPNVQSFYETGIVASLYEHLLMSPELAHLDIRHEMPFQGPRGAPKRVDIWLRPANGGYPHLLEVGDFRVKKIHDDVLKMKRLNPNGSNWFLAFFRKPQAANDPMRILRQSLKRKDGIRKDRIEADERLVDSFDVYRPSGDHDRFGAALLRVKQ
ncbi:hypothetical protein [Wenzhouxiangella sp. EGI_FJ10305]|uniref:hypothetical protein n=1 Tax=Wenzhouxiangella sp. EGI_FJ10305 TaxID=3243768 RepID=UPI0035DF5429